MYNILVLTINEYQRCVKSEKYYFSEFSHFPEFSIIPKNPKNPKNLPEWYLTSIRVEIEDFMKRMDLVAFLMVFFSFKANWWYLNLNNSER